jgi:hypothetical protein
MSLGERPFRRVHLTAPLAFAALDSKLRAHVGGQVG